MENIKILREICQKPVINSSGENWYGKLVSRKFSIYFTKLFIFLKTTPNQVTIIHIASGIIGSLLLLSNHFVMILIGLIMLQLWLIFDCSDGEVARYTKKFSEKGIYLDYIGHYLFNPFVFLPFFVFTYTHDATNLKLIFGVILLLFSIFKRLSGDIVEIIKAKRILETNNRRYNFSSGEIKQVTNKKTELEKIILFIYNTVTVMLILSLITILRYFNINLVDFIFYFYATTLPIIVLGSFYLNYRKKV